MKNALDVGKAAEHLVCADLLLQGYRAFLSDQGLPYDVLIEHGGRLIRVQVKSTLAQCNVNMKGRNPRMSYSGGVRYRGRKQKGERLSDIHCDIVALVALDIRAIAYIPLKYCGQTVQLAAPNQELTTRIIREVTAWAHPITGYPIEAALRDDSDLYGPRKRILTHCPAGHPYPPRQPGQSRRQCSKCSNKNWRVNRDKRMEAARAQTS
jgi:hypothetical protein